MTLKGDLMNQNAERYIYSRRDNGDHYRRFKAHPASVIHAETEEQALRNADIARKPDVTDLPDQPCRFRGQVEIYRAVDKPVRTGGGRQLPWDCAEEVFPFVRSRGWPLVGQCQIDEEEDEQPGAETIQASREASGWKDSISAAWLSTSVLCGTMRGRDRPRASWTWLPPADPVRDRPRRWRRSGP